MKVGTISPEQKGGPRGDMGRGVGMKNADGLTGNLNLRGDRHEGEGEVGALGNLASGHQYTLLRGQRWRVDDPTPSTLFPGDLYP